MPCLKVPKIEQGLLPGTRSNSKVCRKNERIAIHPSGPILLRMPPDKPYLPRFCREEAIWLTYSVGLHCICVGPEVGRVQRWIQTVERESIGNGGAHAFHFPKWWSAGRGGWCLRVLTSKNNNTRVDTHSKNGTCNSRNPKHGGPVLVPGTTGEWVRRKSGKPLPWRVLTEWPMPSAQHECLDFW